MIRLLKSIVFDASRVWSPLRTLRNSAWQVAIRQSEGLKTLRTERRKARQRLFINTFKSALLLIIVLFCSLLALCFIPEAVTDRFFSRVEWFRFDKVENAYSTVSETLGATATIIGLGFVVIGFLFDAVKDKTQRTLEELFRITYLYHVFSISVVSVAFLAFLNCFKYTESHYVAKNFAVLASGLMLIDITAIGFLFYKLLKLFNPEYLTELSRKQLLDLARFTLLEDKFTKVSSDIYKERLIAYGFTEKYQLASFLSKEAPSWSWLSVENKKPMKLRDVHFPLLKLVLNRHANSKTKGFVAMKNGFDLQANHGIIALDKEIKFKYWERISLRTAYLTTTPSKITGEYDKVKERLSKRLIKAAESGDTDILGQSLEEIEKLYDIYYKSNQ